MSLWLFFLGAMVVWPFVYHYEMRRLRTYRRAKMEEMLRKDTERRNEDLRRAIARKQWLDENKPKLYFNTVSGVTAVLRPADYTEAQRRTELARISEYWPSQTVLMPIRQTFVFVTKTGEETIQKGVDRGGNSVRRYKVAGLLASLHEIAYAGGAILEKKEDIFVPFVNESLMSFSGQAALIQDGFDKASVLTLIESQAPAELQSLY